ncbi:helix-turn-helix transcriptional regulator [Amycolatopsis silviterrae]|uniref:LuxR C-terminal-related transcriptional regulator n=1 Tax=Amycolatopsis silviterrae TaxID=1656914 RepID=A0ABW5H4A3_9PSEU
MVEKEFVGRSAELAACLDRAAAVTVVEGRPGIGKTRLLAEVARRAADPVCAVPAAEPGGEGPLGFARRLAAAVGTETREALVVVDDAQWADEPSLRLLMSLVARPGSDRRLVLSVRDGQQQPALARLLRAERVPARYVPLPAFTDDEVARLLPGHDEAERARIAAAAEHVPLYLLLLADLPPHEWPGPDGGTTAEDRPMLPAERVLFAEVSALPEPERLVAQAAACGGAAIDADLVQAMTVLPRAEVGLAIERLLYRGVLAGGAAGLRFRHPLVRAAAGRLAGRGWAAGAHRRAAEYLRELDAPLTLRAYHLEKSLYRHDLVAVGELASAGEEVLGTDPAAGARWLGAAVANLPERMRGGHEHCRLSVLRAEALLTSGRPAEARALLAALPDSPRVLALLSRCEHALGRTRRARVIAEAAIAASGKADARAQLELAHLELLDGDTVGAQERLRRTAADPSAGPAVQAAIAALAAIGLACAGRIAEARHAQQAAADGFDLLDDSQARSVLDTVPALCWASCFLDDDRRALALLDRALHLGAAGLRHGLPFLYSARGYVLWKLGRLAEAAEAAAEAEAAATRFGHHDVVPMAAAIRLRVLLATGDRTAAEQQWRTVEKLPRPTVEWWRRTVEHILAEAGFELGMFPGAVEQPVRRTANPLLVARLAQDCRVALAEGRHAEARRCAAEAQERAAVTGLNSDLGIALLARATVLAADNDLAAALTDATAAAVAFGRAAMVLHRGRAVLLVAEVLGRQGNFDAATQRIGEAREVFHSAGAGALLREATKVQRRLAGQRKLQSPSGGRALSRRERQVAEMVVRGLTTKEIAAELFLSPRTVDAHVARVLNKLDLTTRAGIARRLIG